MDDEASDASGTAADDRRPCPFCAEPIRRAAVLCRYCNRDVSPMAVTGTPLAAPDKPADAPKPAHEPQAGIAPTGWSRKRLGLAAGVALLLTVGLGAVALGSGGEPIPVNGQVLLADPDELSKYDAGDSCSGSGGFADLRSGAPVTVADASGTLLGTTSLSSGKMTGGYCAFSFDLGEVQQSDFYQLSVASDRRGLQRYSEQELRSAGENLTLTLGSGGAATPLQECPTAADFTVEALKYYETQEYEDDSHYLYQAKVKSRASSPARVTLLVEAEYANGQSGHNRSGVSAVVPPDASVFIPNTEEGLGPFALAASAPRAYGAPTDVEAVVTKVVPAEECR